MNFRKLNFFRILAINQILSHLNVKTCHYNIQMHKFDPKFPCLGKNISFPDFSVADCNSQKVSRFFLFRVINLTKKT